MPPIKSVFYGFGAWVGSYTGPTSCEWWPRDPSTMLPPYDASKLIKSDLSKNVNAVITGGLPIGQLQVDNPPVSGGQTKIGSTFPNGSMNNSCWLEKNVYDALGPGVKPPRVGYGMQCFDYELTTVYYWNGINANRRFWGYYVQIDSENGNNALVSVWPPGRSQEPGVRPVGAWWLDLPAVADDPVNGFSQVWVGAGRPKQGALFIDAPTASASGMGSPKLPPASGYDAVPVVS